MGRRGLRTRCLRLLDESMLAFVYLSQLSVTLTEANSDVRLNLKLESERKFKRKVQVCEILCKVSESQMAERIVTGTVMSPERSPETLHPGWVFSLCGKPTEKLPFIFPPAPSSSFYLATLHSCS